MSSMNTPIVGIAGGIGSGKSAVAGHFVQLGAVLVDADRLAKDALLRPDVIAKLTDWWGTDILDDQGLPDRGRIADIVFHDPDQRSRLESVIHPIVQAERNQIIRQAKDDPDVPMVVLDVPLLFEVGLHDQCDAVVFVDVDFQTRLRRVQMSRGWSGEELRRREKSQWPLEKKLALSDYVIQNNAREAECFDHVRGVFTRIVSS